MGAHHTSRRPNFPETPMRRTNRLSAAATVAALSLCTFAPAAGAQEQLPPEREGPDVQAEAQEVTGGLEAEPSEEFAASAHLLGDLFGTRAQLAERGIPIDPIYTADFTSNFRNGADTSGSAFLHI